VAIAIFRVRLSLGIVLAVLLICLSAVSLGFAADEKDAKVQTLRQTGKQLLDVGYEQYRRGMYDNAKETLGKAAAYRQYLSVSDASKLDTLLEKLSSQSRPDVNQISGQSVEQITPVQPTEPVQIQPQTQQPAVNPEYIEFVPVEAGDIKQSSPLPAEQTEVQPEFITPVGQEPNLGIEVSQPLQPQQVQPQVPAAERAKEDYIEVVRQKQRIQQSYTKAVVNETIAKAKEYADKEDFLKAKDEINRSLTIVEKNKLLLGDTDYAQYKASLQQLLDQINTRQTEVDNFKAEKTKAEAQTTQEKLRAQQTADRQQRIQDLLTHSLEFQEQQRYEESLAQLETLLAIDPLNREALRNKQTLEDVINLRRQLEVKKEMGREEQNVFYDTQKSMIPHADLITYPRNWQDIAARKAKAISGLSPADAAVYKQLETLVDLSALTPDTPFNEAIDIIRTSVDPPLKINVRWKDLEENAYIEADTAIGMQGLSGIPLGKALKDLLDTIASSATPIAFAVEDGIITIATTSVLPANLVTRVYDVTELVDIKADFTTGVWTPGEATSAPATTTTTTVELDQERLDNATIVIQMIQESTEPMSWLVNGGQGTISFQSTRLIISQTPKIHEQIQKLLEDMRESLGQQVSIEARFLFVTENFLEDIGFGVSSMRIATSKIGKFGDTVLGFGSQTFTTPESTGLPGNMAGDFTTGGGSVPPALQLIGGLSYGGILDDLAVTFFLRATQAHKDAKVLTAPRVTVISGERAAISLTKQIPYIENYTFTELTGVDQPTRIISQPTLGAPVLGGVLLSVIPTISADKKYVILYIETSYQKIDLKDFDTLDAQGNVFPTQQPLAETSTVQTHVNVPDGGTLLIGGQKLGAEANKEAGVPGLSKVPLLGRLFSSRSKIKDQEVLLVLVKPTIILQEEAEREYFAPLE
jgi:type II secretory pathway component GspD/PulD (secretin)